MGLFATLDQNLTIAGNLTYADFIDMYEIDKLALRDDLIAPPDVTYRWYQHNALTHIAVRSGATGKIAGYIAILPVTDELFERIKAGDFKDNDLSTENIRIYNSPGLYKLYASCTCVHPDYRNTAAFSKLYTALLRMLYDLAAEKGIYISDIIAEASLRDGRKLCKILGFKKLSDTMLNTELYVASLLPPTLRLNCSQGFKLIRLYQDKCTELTMMTGRPAPMPAVANA